MKKRDRLNKRRVAPQGNEPPSPALPQGRPRHVWGAVLGFLILSMLLNINNIHNELVYDDHEAITNNENAHGVGNTGRIFTTPSWWSSSVTYVSHYRPMTTWSYAINYSLHGLAPEGYHLVNNALHGFVSALVFIVLTSSGIANPPALIAAIFFLAHPVHVEAVNWANCRADILAGGFILLSLLFHIKSLQTHGRRRNLYVAAGLLGFVLAGLSKETGFMTPFVVVIWDLVVFDSMKRESIRRRFRGGAWKEYGLYLLVLAIFVWSRTELVGGATEATVSKMASPLGDAGFTQRFYTGSYVIVRYAWLLLWPAHLSVDYSPDEITMIRSLADPKTIAGLVFVLVYLVMMILSGKRSKVVGFSMAMAMIVFAPGANILFPVGTIMAERLMYLPVLAFCVPLSIAIWSWIGNRAPKLVTVAIAVAISVGYGARTIARNRDWKNEETLFRSALAVSPRSAMAHKNLASVLHQKGRHADAILLAEEAVDILPDFPDAHLVLGNCYFMTARFLEAEKQYRTTLELVPRHASAYLNLGAVYHVVGRFDEALAHFDTAIELDPRLDLAWFNRIHSLIALGRLGEAESALERAVRRFPHHPAKAEAQAKIDSARKGLKRSRVQRFEVQEEEDALFRHRISVSGHLEMHDKG